MDRYVYVASSWRNPLQPPFCEELTRRGIEHYDFRNPPEGTGFSWRDVRPDGAGESLAAKGEDWEQANDFVRMVHHPVADAAFASDFNAIQRADTVVMLLPCGKSAHLELGWACGRRRTAVLLEDPVEPELMYRMADLMTPRIDVLLDWIQYG